jgi:protein-S-isoprenylcysteine O-methyltransferase Ste14
MTTRTSLALDAGNITKIGVGVIIALVVIGFLLSLVITAIVGRIIILVVVVLLAVFVWQQRSSIENKISEHKCNLTFFGMHLDPPDSLKSHCG